MKKLFLTFFFLTLSFTLAQHEVKLISPGVNLPEKSTEIFTKVQFKWHSVPSAVSYSILISEKEKDFYKLIFTSTEKELKKDTIFMAPAGVLKSFSNYRWNLKVELSTGKTIISEFYYFSTGKLEPYENPKGNEYEKSDLFNSPSEPGLRIATSELIIPIKKDGKIKYRQIYIAKKIKTKYKLLYKSPRILPKETTHKIPPKFLTDKSQFRWNMKTVGKNGKSTFSSLNYFYTDFSQSTVIKKVKSFQPVKILSPGEKQKNKFRIDNETPELRWSNFEDSLEKQVIIYELENDKEKVIFLSEQLHFAAEKFRVPKGILSVGKSYGWQIKSITPDGKEIYSDEYYFTVEEKKDIFIQPKIVPKEKEEIFLALKYAGLVNRTVNAIYENGTVFLPVSEILSNLEIETKFDTKSKILSAKNIFKQKSLLIDLSKNKIQFGDSIFTLSDFKYQSNDFELFFTSEFFSKILNIDTRVDLSNLNVVINSAEPLPILNRKLREDKYGFFYNHPKENYKKQVDFNRLPKYANFGVVDYQLSHSINKHTSPSTYYFLGAGGELMGGDIQIITRGNFRESKFGENRTEARWEYVFEKNDYISSFSAGTLDFEGLQHTTFDGISITNNPIEPRTEFGKIKITDVGNPNSTIELYLNNQLFDVVKSDATGNFSFDLPLNYGTSLVKLKFFGNFGEYEEKTKLYQIPVLMLQQNEVNYNLDVGKQNITRYDLRSFNIAYGFADWLTNRIGIEHLKIDNQKPVIYNTTSARLFDSYFANFSFSPTNFYNFSIDAMLPSQLSLDFEYSKFAKEGFFNQANITDRISSHIFYPIQIFGSQINFQSFYTYSKTKVNDINDLTFGISSYLSYFSPSINYHLVNLQNKNLKFTNNTIDVGFNWSLNFLHYYIEFMRGSILTSRFYYNISESRSENFSVSLSGNLFESGRYQISHTENLANSFSLTQLNILFYFPFTQFSTSLSKETFSTSVIGSANYNSSTREINLFNRLQIGKSGAIIRLFVDENGNGIYDANEKLIKDAKVDIEVAETKYFPGGIIAAYELNQYTPYKVTIREESIKNPMLISKKKSFVFVTEPNSFKEINIPFYIAGEVSGKVLRKLLKTNIPVAGLRIHIVNLVTEETSTVTTFSDGSFYYFGLLPGKYKVVADKEQLSSINATIPQGNYEFEVQGDINAKENNFDIYIEN